MKALNYLIMLAAVAGMVACNKKDDSTPTPETPAKSLTANVHLYFTSETDPYISYKIYAIGKDGTSETDITSKAQRTKLDTLDRDKNLWDSYALGVCTWSQEEKNKIYAMSFDDTYTEAGTYGYKVVFSKKDGVTIKDTVNYLYDWSFKILSRSGLSISTGSHSAVISQFNPTNFDSELARLNSDANRKFTVRAE